MARSTLPARPVLAAGRFRVPGVVLPVQIPDAIADDLVYVFTKKAAELIGVAPCTITRWRDLGYLTPVPGSPPRKPVYLWDDVVEAEFTATQNGLRTSGIDPRTQRSRAA